MIFKIPQESNYFLLVFSTSLVKKNYNWYLDDVEHFVEEDTIVLIDFSFPTKWEWWIYYLSLSGLLSLHAFYLVLNWLLPCWLVSGLLNATAGPCGWYNGYPIRTLPYIICFGLSDSITTHSWLCLFESSSPSISWMYAGIVSLVIGDIPIYGCYWFDEEYVTLCKCFLCYLFWINDWGVRLSTVDRRLAIFSII